MTPATPARRVALFVFFTPIVALILFGISQIQWGQVPTVVVRVGIWALILGPIVWAFFVLVNWMWDGVYGPSDAERKQGRERGVHRTSLVEWAERRNKK